MTGMQVVLRKIEYHKKDIQKNNTRKKKLIAVIIIPLSYGLLRELTWSLSKENNPLPSG